MNRTSTMDIHHYSFLEKEVQYLSHPLKRKYFEYKILVLEQSEFCNRFYKICLEHVGFNKLCIKTIDDYINCRDTINEYDVLIVNLYFFKDCKDLEYNLMFLKKLNPNLSIIGITVDPDYKFSNLSSLNLISDIIITPITYNFLEHIITKVLHEKENSQ